MVARLFLFIFARRSRWRGLNASYVKSFPEEFSRLRCMRKSELRDVGQRKMS